jgi:hypothetical protein
MAEKAGFDVCPFQGPGEQRIVEQIDLADREIIGGAPPRVDQIELCRRRRLRGSLGPIFPRHFGTSIAKYRSVIGEPGGGSLP